MFCSIQRDGRGGMTAEIKMGDAIHSAVDRDGMRDTTSTSDTSMCSGDIM